jgi:hypothetical protein
VKLRVCARRGEKASQFVPGEALNSHKESSFAPESYFGALPIVRIPRFKTEQTELNTPDFHHVILASAVRALALFNFHVCG